MPSMAWTCKPPGIAPDEREVLDRAKAELLGEPT